MFFSSGVQPVRSLRAFGVSRRSVAYIFTASPTSGASYEVTFMHQRSGIPQAGTDRTARAGFRTKAGLIPDVTYRLQVVAVLGGAKSTPVSTDFTTWPDGKTAVTALCANYVMCSVRHYDFTAKIHPPSNFSMTIL